MKGYSFITLIFGFASTSRIASAGHLPPPLDVIPILLPDGLEWIQQHGNISIEGKAILGSSVGIGTISPSGKLHTEDTQYDVGTGLCPIGYTEGDYDGEGDAADCRAIGIVAQANGNVGIGTTGPIEMLHIDGDDPDILLDINSSSPKSMADIEFGQDGVIEAFMGWDKASDSLIFSTSDVVDHMTIDSAGNVGIGTTGPSNPLHVEVPNASSIPNMRLSRAGVTEVLELGSRTGIFMSANGFNIGTKDSSGLYLRTNNVIRMAVVGNTGNVGIGTTAPNYPLEMGSGAHVTAGGVWTNASSRKYKENIRDLTTEEAITALEELKPTRFNYKVDKEDEYLGFIAEDVPGLVASKDRKGLSPMDIVAVLTKVVQQQQKEIDALKAQLNAGQ